MLKCTDFITVTDSLFCVEYARDQQMRDTFQPSRLTGVRVEAVMTQQIL